MPVFSWIAVSRTFDPDGGFWLAHEIVSVLPYAMLVPDVGDVMVMGSVGGGVTHVFPVVTHAPHVGPGHVEVLV